MPAAQTWATVKNSTVPSNLKRALARLICSWCAHHQTIEKKMKTTERYPQNYTMRDSVDANAGKEAEKLNLTHSATLA